jgi:NAD(P)H-dependent FMN reductase
MNLYIPIILGTAREGRRSEQAARYVLGQAQGLESVETELIDVRGANEDFAQKAEKADGFIIVSPEYNHGYPGELKEFLDRLYNEYHKKPVGFCGVSTGGMGGARAVEQLRLVAIEFHMVPIHEALYFSNIKDGIDEEAFTQRAAKFFEELLWYAKALKTARENLT